MKLDPDDHWSSLSEKQTARLLSMWFWSGFAFGLIAGFLVCLAIGLAV